MGRPAKDNGPRLYMGMFIYRRDNPGAALRWYTIAPGYQADTLAGIKELIRYHRKHEG